jgi:hypothetical protein
MLKVVLQDKNISIIELFTKLTKLKDGPIKQLKRELELTERRSG